MTRLTLIESHAQHLEALTVANNKRFAVAEFKRALRASSQADACAVAQGVLLNPPVELAHMKLVALITAIPKFGERRVTATCAYAAIITSDKRLRDLTARQRQAAATALRLPLSQVRAVSPIPQGGVTVAVFQAVADELRHYIPEVELNRVIFQVFEAARRAQQPANLEAAA